MPYLYKVTLADRDEAQFFYSGYAFDSESDERKDATQRAHKVAAFFDTTVTSIEKAATCEKR